MRRFGILFSSCGIGSLVIAGAVAAQSSTESYTYDALGRLVEIGTTGGQNDDETQSICYDASGNRTRYRASSDGSSANCSTGGGAAPEPEPTPTPTPTPPGNYPPVAVNDVVSGKCDTGKIVNLTANDTDPEANYPLELVAIVRDSGANGTALVMSESSALVEFGPLEGVTIFTYTVEDSLGASSTGILSATAANCAGSGA